MRRGFREIREIKSEEKLNKDRKEDLGYLKIKPETNITFEEANDFWDKLFKEMEES